MNSTRILIYSEFLKRRFTVNNLFNDETKTLNMINNHIPLDKYMNKTDFLPENFYFSKNNIVFVFPRYSISSDDQDEVSIAVSMNEFKSIFSDKLKCALNGN